MSLPILSAESIQAIRDDKDLRQTAHPMDRLSMLLEMAKRDDNVMQKHLISILLTVIDGLHTRICELEATVRSADHAPS